VSADTNRGASTGANLDATALAERIRSGAITAREVVDAALERARADRFGAVRSVDEEAARRRADELDATRATHGEAVGPLHGVPILLKANLCRLGSTTDCGSALLASYRPPHSATAVDRLEIAGAVVIGTTHMDEFGMGSTGEHCAFGRTTNPRTPSGSAPLAPGGSSSGSAAAVAAGIVPIALGSDTGGSVRQPAAFCEVFGHKPTWGGVSRFGLVAFASSLDTVGALARSARDLELVLACMAGRDRYDATTFDLDVERRPSDLAGVRIGAIDARAMPGVAEDVAAAYASTLEHARELGAAIERIELPHLEHGVPAYYVIASAEASSNLARYDGVRYGARVDGDGSLESMTTATRDTGFGPEVARRVLMGTHVLSSGFYDAWFDRAARVRRLVVRDFEAAHAAVDLVALPTAPTPAFELGSVRDPLELYRGDALTVPASLAGLPATSLPALRDGDGGRPGIGVQLIGPGGADMRVLAAARALRPAAVDAVDALDASGGAA